jgi:hypothetical protein
MAFDPDAYLASKQAAPAPALAFDPDAYLRATSSGVPSGPRRASATVDQIPGYGRAVPAATAPAAPAEPASFTERLLAPVETVVALGTSAITSPLVEAAKVFGTLTSGKFGTQEGIRAGEATGRKVQQFFQPALSPTAQAQTQAIGNALAATGLQGVPMNMLGDIATLARPAVQQVAPIVKAPIEARQQRVKAERVRQSELAAPRIDAAKDAADIGIALDPSISNPSAANRARVAAVGSTALQGNLSKLNLPQVAKAAREDMGLPETVKLDAKAFDTARARPEISGAYDKVRGIPNVVADQTVFADLDGLRIAPTIGDTGQAAAINGFIDTVKTQLQSGANGSTIVDSIRQLRRDAQAIYNQQTAGINPPSPTAIAQADVSMGVAKALETAIENSISDPKLVTDFRNARTALARTYDYERATNLATGVVDPQALAKLAAEGRPLSGKLAKIANVAANFPEVMQGGVVREPTWREKLTRSGAAGTVGAVVGAPFGLVGSIAGGAAGAGIGNVAAAAAARRMAQPSFQRQKAMPQDYRPIPSGLTPAEINYGPNQLVPYDFSQQSFTAPNFVMMGEQYGPQVTPTMPPTNRLLGAPSAEGTMAALRAEDVRRAGVSRAVGQQAEAQAEAAAAASRRPASREVILDLDPVTGKLREASQGVRGATPETFSNFGAALQTAADKVTAGKRFDLTAAEKVAWDKTRVDLSEVAPGFKTLTDKAIAEKMLDRAWVEQTATKAREKAAAFEQLAARAKSERDRQAAQANRERMMDLAEQMEETLGRARPDVSGKQQGPKTREFQRNRLAAEQEVRNALAR